MRPSRHLGPSHYLMLIIVGAFSMPLLPVGTVVNAQTGNAAVSAVMIPAQQARDNLPAADGSLWRFEGPTNMISGGHSVSDPPYSGRINDLALDPTNPAVLYATGATGGLWKSADGGQTWASRSVGWPLQSATAVAVDPSNSNRIYVGSGDYKRLDHVEPYSIGIGISNDGGLTWQWSADGKSEMFNYTVSRIVVDTQNPQNVLAATGRGSRLPGGSIFRLVNGGSTWTNVGLPDANWDDLALCDGHIFWAAGTRRHNLDSDGSDSQSGLIYNSTDGGTTWIPIFEFLTPHPDVIKIACNPSRNVGVFAAVYVNSTVHVLVTSDHGNHWTESTITPAVSGWGGPWGHSAFALTFGRIYIGASSLVAAPIALGPLTLISDQNLGMTNDHQCIVADPAEQDAVYVCSDKGVYHYSPTTGGRSLSKTLAVTQISRMDVHPRDGGLIAFGAQDLGEIVNFFGNGNDVAALLKPPTWALMSGGDGGGAAFKGDVSSHVYVSNTYGEITRYDGSPVPPPPPANIPACPADGLCDLQHPVIDVRSPLLYRSDLDILDWGGTASLAEISHPDAVAGATSGETLPLTSLPVNNPIVRALAACPSNSNAQFLYAGSDYGDVLYLDTTVPGQTWIALPRTGLPTVRAPILAISPSPTNCSDVLVGIGYEDEIEPPVSSSIRRGSNAFLGFGTPGDRLFHSTNALAGVWQSAHSSGGAQPLPFAPVSGIVRHPSAPDSIWFVGTDIGVFRTDNAGVTWTNASNKLGLPNTLVRDLRMSGNTLYAGTFGRGVWSMDVTRPASFFSVRGVVTQAAKPTVNPVSVSASGPGRIFKYLKNTLTSGTTVTTAPITVTASATIAAATVSISAFNTASVSLHTPSGLTIAMPAVSVGLTLTQFQLTGSSAAALVGLGTAGDWTFTLVGKSISIKGGILSPSVLSASVDLQFNGAVTTTSGTDGEFTIEYLAQGAHLLSVAATGVNPVPLNLSSSITNLNIVIPAVGKYSLEPKGIRVEPRQRVSYTLAYTITNGRSWRDMANVDLLVEDQSPEPSSSGCHHSSEREEECDRSHRRHDHGDKGIILWLRFDAIHGTFRLVDPESGRAGREFYPGEHSRLENEWATVHLSRSSVQTNVPDSSSFTLNIELSFKHDAAHQIYDVRVLGADQTGLSQGPGVAGRLQVGEVPPVPLPPVEFDEQAP